MSAAAGFLPFLQQYLQQPQAPPVQAPAPAQPQVSAQPSAPAQGPQQAQVPPPPPAPEETKGHKLLELLRGGLVGGLSGLAANAQTYAATGRNAGIGGGIGAGFTQSLPMQAQMQQAELGQKQAQTELTKQQATMVQTPYGPLPMALAKVIFGPAIKAESAKDVQASKSQTAKDVANINTQSQQQIHRYMPIPGVGMFDTQTRQVMPGTEQGITITPEIAADHNLPQEFIGKPMKISDLNGMMRFENQQQSPMMTDQGPVVVDKKSATARPVKGPAGQTFGPPALASPREVGDENNPGQTVNVRAGQSFGKPGVQSASVQVPRKAELAEVPTNVGNQKVAFTTAIQHADLLRRAAKALNNGDVQALSGLENAFANAFGSSGPVTAQVIGDAYTHEAQRMLSGGHVTEGDINKVGKTIDPNKQNYDQIDKVLGAYQALAQSKMNMLNQQTQNAVKQSQPPKKSSGQQGQKPPGW